MVIEQSSSSNFCQLSRGRKMKLAGAWNRGERPLRSQLAMISMGKDTRKLGSSDRGGARAKVTFERGGGGDILVHLLLHVLPLP